VEVPLRGGRRIGQFPKNDDTGMCFARRPGFSLAGRSRASRNLDRRVFTRDKVGANGHNGLIDQFNDRASELSTVVSAALAYICNKSRPTVRYAAELP
jgi:hypothetical protein